MDTQPIKNLICKNVHSLAQPILVLLGIYQRSMSSNDPDSKVHGANMGPTWGRQDPGGPFVGPKNLAIWGLLLALMIYCTPAGAL